MQYTLMEMGDGADFTFATQNGRQGEVKNLENANQEAMQQQAGGQQGQ